MNPSWASLSMGGVVLDRFGRGSTGGERFGLESQGEVPRRRRVPYWRPWVALGVLLLLFSLLAGGGGWLSARGAMVHDYALLLGFAASCLFGGFLPELALQGRARAFRGVSRCALSCALLCSLLALGFGGVGVFILALFPLACSFGAVFCFSRVLPREGE